MNLKGIAYHEAGHAVMARVLHIPSGEASIVANGDRLGYSVSVSEFYKLIALWEEQALGRKIQREDGHWVRTEPVGDRKFRDRWLNAGPYAEARSIVIVLLAGVEAEKELQGIETPEFGALDFFEAAEIAHIELLDSDWDRLERVTRWLIRRHRDRIERVAEALLQHRTLTKEQIDEICRQEADLAERETEQL